MWYTYIGEDGYVHREAFRPNALGEELINDWDAVRDSEDQREVNKFLWQNCQDALNIVRNQLGVIEVLSEMLDHQEEYISQLEAETRDEYGE